MILSRPEGELCLQEQCIPGDASASDGCCNCLSDCCFVIMAALVGGIYSAKSVLQSQLREQLRPIFFPGGPIQEARDANASDFGVTHHGCGFASKSTGSS